MWSQEKHMYHWKSEQRGICGDSDLGSGGDWSITAMSHGGWLTLKKEEQETDLWLKCSPVGRSPLLHNLLLRQHCFSFLFVCTGSYHVVQGGVLPQRWKNDEGKMPATVSASQMDSFL